MLAAVSFMQTSRRVHTYDVLSDLIDSRLVFFFPFSVYFVMCIVSYECH